MEILIIGSKGFIGSHLYKYFKTNKFEVYGCDIHPDNEDLNYFQIDEINTNYNIIFKKRKIDICINCSGAASVPLSIEFALKDFNLNTVNVFRILDSIRLNQSSCKFINLSSAAVYGNPINLPIIENSSLNPLSPYGIHKMQAEQICKEFYDFYNIPTCSLRIFSAYGNGLKKQLFWDMYQKFMNNNKIELFGTGNETRDFIHIDDIVNAVCLVIKNSKFQADNINVANGNEYSIFQITEIFINILKTEKKIFFNNKVKLGDPINWKADITKLKEMGYETKINIEYGINNYIQWIKGL
jgi:dTDP-glucose 4,6-dehydratase/UDP-glucose 4-epimerase